MGRKHKNAAAREAGGKGAGAGRDDQQQQEAQSDQFVDPPKASIASHPDVGVAIACGLELRVYDARSAHAHGEPGSAGFAATIHCSSSAYASFMLFHHTSVSSQ
jgi:hypothetical protein